MIRTKKIKTTVDPIRETEKKYCSLALTAGIVIGLAFILLSMKPVGKGFILGTLFSVINFVLMGETLPMRLGTSRNRATAISGISILVRYALIALPLGMAIKMEVFNMAATVCGLFMVQILILCEQLVRTSFSSTHKRPDF